MLDPSNPMLDPSKMKQLTKDLPTKSAKIRCLAQSGVARADIARFLGVRYQFVRNVLVQAEQGRDASGSGSAAGGDRPSHRLKIGPSGQVTLPPALLAELGVGPGGTLFAVSGDGEVHLLSPQLAIQRAREIVRRFVPEDASLVDDLLEDRRREVARESGRG
jgi:bifunctional DNA-binding transcriptional regulator/antitoxin component of YhaV-PrlF toxin-antitoxin module